MFTMGCAGVRITAVVQLYMLCPASSGMVEVNGTMKTAISGHRMTLPFIWEAFFCLVVSSDFTMVLLQKEGYRRSFSSDRKRLV